MKVKTNFKNILILSIQILVICLSISMTVGLLGFVNEYNKTFDVWYSFSNGAIIAFLYAFSTTLFLFNVIVSFIFFSTIVIEKNME